MIEDDDPLGAALGFYQRFHLPVINPADLVLVIEVPDLGLVMHKSKAVALQGEAVGMGPAVAQNAAVRVGSPAAASHIRPARRADHREGPGARIDKIIERRLDRFGNSL